MLGFTMVPFCLGAGGAAPPGTTPPLGADSVVTTPYFRRTIFFVCVKSLATNR